MDYHTKMYLTFAPYTQTGREWLLTQYRLLEAYQRHLDDTDGVSDTRYDDAFDAMEKEGQGPLDPVIAQQIKFWAPLDGVLLPGFSLREEKGSQALHFMDDDGTLEVNRVAHILERYLELYNPRGYITFEYAMTANGHTDGAFGGGACLVSAQGSTWKTTRDGRDEMRKKFLKSQEKPKATPQRRTRKAR